MIPTQKQAFSIPDDICYLNCAYMSPQLKRVTEAGLRGVAAKASPWEVSAESFFTLPEQVRGLFARLIGASSDDIAIVPAVSYGMGVAAKNVPVGAGDNILVLEDQFPSNVYPWQALAREREAVLATVARPKDCDWAAAVCENIDARTAVVALPQCHWTDGSLVDLPRVRRRCDEVGAALVLDTSQSLGALPFSVGDIRPDFMVVAGYKWLLGPYSLSFMYVDKRYHQGQPLEYNWINRENSEDFAGLANYRDAFQPGARRFDVGERSNFALMPMALEALSQLLEWGVENIAATLGRLTAAMVAGAQRLGLDAVPAPARAPHMTGLQIPDIVAQALSQRLPQEKVYVSMRGKSMRISPHLYNSERDIERLLGVLETTLK